MPQLTLRRRCLLGLLVAAGCLALLLAVPASRHAMLRSAGWMLVAEDPPVKADIIVVSTDSLAAGILEAGKLFDAGYAARVAVFEHPPGPLQAELARRNLPRIDLQAWSVDLLHALGIHQVSLIPAVVGTNDEGEVLRHWCRANGIRSILFVSVADHSRRSRRVLNRALVRNGVAVAVRWARLSTFDPDHWWQDRHGQRTEIIESQKLLLDILRYPF